MNEVSKGVKKVITKHPRESIRPQNDIKYRRQELKKRPQEIEPLTPKAFDF